MSLTVALLAAQLAFPQALPRLAPELSCPRCISIAQAPAPPSSAAEMDLRLRIDELDARIRAISTAFPVWAAAMTYVGISVAPLSLFGVLFIALGAALATEGLAALIVVGAVLLGIGGAGVVVGVVGYVSGRNVQSSNTEERGNLTNEKTRLEEELRQLQRPRSGGVGLPEGLVIARF